MTARVEAERAIADVLNKHLLRIDGKTAAEWRTACRGCDWVSPDLVRIGPVDGYKAEHRAHVASVLADLMAERQAEAWDEGAVYGHAPDEFMDYDANPYRPDPKDTRDE